MELQASGLTHGVSTLHAHAMYTMLAVYITCFLHLKPLSWGPLVTVDQLHSLTTLWLRDERCASETTPHTVGVIHNVCCVQGLLDCLLCSPTGSSTARAAVAAVYDHLATPAVWVSVSHSPPRERVDLYNSVYWHDMQVRAVICEVRSSYHANMDCVELCKYVGTAHDDRSQKSRNTNIYDGRPC